MSASETVDDFASSMPADYRLRFDAPAIAAHAALVASRHDAPLRVGLVGEEPGRVVVCVAADDRPGLLSLITAAFVLEGVDVLEGDAWCRQRADGAPEAVDVFWVRSIDGAPVDADRVNRVRATLEGLISGMPASPRRSARTEAKPAKALPPPTCVRFLEGADGGLAVLEVETGDRSGLLHAVTRALFAERVQIVRSEVRTKGDRVLDRFTVVEFDGAPIDERRRLDVQVAVLGAIESEQTPRAPGAA